MSRLLAVRYDCVCRVGRGWTFAHTPAGVAVCGARPRTSGHFIGPFQTRCMAVAKHPGRRAVGSAGDDVILPGKQTVCKSNPRQSFYIHLSWSSLSLFRRAFLKRAESSTTQSRTKPSSKYTYRVHCFDHIVGLGHHGSAPIVFAAVVANVCSNKITTNAPSQYENAATSRQQCPPG